MPIYVWVTVVFIGVATIIFGAGFWMLSRKSVLEERLEKMTPGQTQSQTIFDQPQTAWQKIFGIFGGAVPVRPQEYGKYRRTLVAAGIKKELLPVFLGVKFLLFIGLPVAYLMLYGLPVEKDFNRMVLTTAILATLGYLLPSIWLTRRMKNRQLEIFHDLPDVLDLLTVCVEAGLSMDAAIMRIANNKHFMQSPLAKELKLASYETLAGKSRHEALRDMAERTMLSDLKAFVSMLIQTEKFGTSLGHSLRVHSDSLRTIRRQKAEEEGAKTAIKLLFPLVFLIMPALFVVMLLPALLRLTKVFAGM